MRFNSEYSKMHGWSIAAMVFLLLAAPVSAQPRLEQGNARALDQTAPLDANPNFIAPVAPTHSPQGAYVPPPLPPPPSALWTFTGVQVHWCSENTYPFCDSIASATCSGSACPVSSCSFYCSYNLLNASGCPAAGSQSETGPGAMGYWFENTCGG
jgi:hypothetical protein